MSQKCGWVFVVLLAYCATYAHGSAVCSTGTFASAEPVLITNGGAGQGKTWEADNAKASSLGGRLPT